MSDIYNVYCDESCHLENDHQPVMVLGAVWCPLDKRREIAGRIRDIKRKHALPPNFEIKWTKVSPAQIEFYLDLIGYFFDEDDLHLRALIVPDKSKLRHDDFGQDHDTFYYKMYFDMLKVIFAPTARYRVYLDIKDTRGAEKVRKLHDVLCNNIYDFSRDIIQRLQLVRSRDVDIMQLADLLIGAVSAVNRGSIASDAKRRIVERIRERSGYALTKTTLLQERKVNLFRWHAREAQG